MTNELIWEPQPGELPHPGETLAETLRVRRVSQVWLAQHTGLSTKHINQIATGNARISPVVAVRIGRALAVDPYFWGRIQADYDINQVLAAERVGLGGD